MLASEVKNLREKYAETDRKMAEKDNNYAKQEAYRNDLMKKYEEVCAMCQMEPQVDYQRVKEEHARHINPSPNTKKP